MRKNKNKPIYKKVWFWIAIILIFLASLCIIVAINESYKKGGYATLWDATDALAFYGDYLSFTGTVIIGIIAIFMSNKANALSEKIVNIETRDRKAFAIINIDCDLEFYCLNDDSDPKFSMLKTLNNKKINLYAYFTKNQYTNDILLFQFSMSNISSNFISGVHLNKIKIIPEVETYEAVSLECDSDNCNLLAPSESKEVLLIIHGFAENLKRHKGPKPLDYLGSEFDMELEFEIYNLMKEKTTLVINVSTEKPKKHNNKEGELYKIEYSLSLNEFQEV